MSTAKQSRHSHFQRGSGTYACRSCGHQTRDTGDNGDVKLCPICYELAGYDNQLSDDRRLSSAEVENVRSLLNQLCHQVNNPEVATTEFPSLANYIGFVGPVPVIPSSPLSKATEELGEVTEEDGVGSGGTGEEEHPQAEGEGSYFVWVKGIPDDPDFVLIVDSTSSYQARRVAKRMVAKHMSLEGLTFSAQRA